MPCCSKYNALAKKYMGYAKARTDNDAWQSLLYGIALTMTFDKKDHKEVVLSLINTFPSPEKTRSICETGAPITDEVKKTWSAKHVVNGVCKASENWDHLKASMVNCDREGIRKHYLFQRQKGPDMLMLESGCDVPVMDRWMIRKVLNPSGEKLDNETKQALDKEVTSAQSRKGLYKLYRDEIEKQAKECNVPVGIYHESCWLEQVFGDNSSEAESYVNELIDIKKENA